MQELKRAIQAAAKKLYDTDIEPELSRPAEQFGDFATNAALQLAKKSAKSPQEIARALADELKDQPGIESVKIAGPGFINFTLTDETLAAVVLKASDLPRPKAGQEILVEFGDPNPFKEMHIGHLYSYIVGDAISSLLEVQGAKVKRLSYHGDVGLHVAKAIWGMQKQGVKPGIESTVKNNIGHYYVVGAQAYEKDENAKIEIHDINEHIYKQDDEEINALYKFGREKSLGYFQEHLRDLNIRNDRQYFESQTAEIGTEVVKKYVGSVFKESDGAIIYEGKKVGLHTRVFITSKGLPTYETKDLGLVELKKTYFPSATRSIIITANEQAEYFKVMLSALNEFDKDLASKTTHLSHGFVSLSTGKMSSRTGNVYSGLSAIVDIDQQIDKIYPKASRETRNAAIKYDFLKHRLGSDIVYDVEASFNLEGNSGPYLQYAHARACSILKKAADGIEAKIEEFDESERSLARKISEYPEVVENSADELMPHHVCTYLYELAQTFNSFYEKSRIIGDQREAVRLALVRAYKDVLASGLGILNIAAPDKM